MSKIGIIYKLVSTDININEIYVGSTCNFRTRKSHHKGKCNNETDKAYNFNVYKYIRANGGWDAFDMIQLEEVKHDTRQQLHARERYWIEELKATLNKVIPTQTEVEYYAKYYKDNKDIIKIKDAEYHQKNKEIINIKHAEYYNKNRENIRQKAKQPYDCGCGSKITVESKSRHQKSIKHKNWLSTQ